MIEDFADEEVGWNDWVVSPCENVGWSDWMVSVSEDTGWIGIILYTSSGTSCHLLLEEKAWLLGEYCCLDTSKTYAGEGEFSSDKDIMVLGARTPTRTSAGSINDPLIQ